MAIKEQVGILIAGLAILIYSKLYVYSRLYTPALKPISLDRPMRSISARGMHNVV